MTKPTNDFQFRPYTLDPISKTLNLKPYILYLPFMDDTRIAVIVSNARIGKTAENLFRITHWVEKARAESASLVCFPEMQVTGYYIDPEIKNPAEPVPGPSSKHLESLARQHDLTILAGLAEAGGNGRVYATHLVIRPDGLAGKYRKLHLGPPEQAVYTAGHEMPIFDAGDFRFGIPALL